MIDWFYAIFFGVLWASLGLIAVAGVRAYWRAEEVGIPPLLIELTLLCLGPGGFIIAALHTTGPKRYDGWSIPFRHGLTW